MKSIVIIVCLSFFMEIPGLQSAFGKDAPDSESKLLQAFETALKAKDKDAILSLFNWEGVSIGNQSYMDQTISDALEQQVKSVKLAPVPKGFRSTYEANGFRFAANVAVTGIIDVKFVQENYSMPILAYGRKDNAFYLAGTVREKIATTNSPPAETPMLTIQVQTADGRPLTNAVIVSADPDTIPRLSFTNLTGGRASFRTDQNGRLTLPLTNSNLFLVAASPGGFGWLPSGDLTNQAVMVIQPWGRVEGIRKNRNHVVTDEHFWLYLDDRYYGQYVEVPVYIFQRKTTTDTEGGFAFDFLPPLKLLIMRVQKQINSSTYFWSVEAKSGETQKLAINTRGRTVFGRVKVGPGLGTNTDLVSYSGVLNSDLKGREGARRMAVFPISADGSFHADWVEPGNYAIELVDFKHDDRSAGVLDPVSVHIPDDTSDAPDAPFDMGTVTVNAAVKPGDIAPDFTVSNLDGKPLKLSDYRGKYVLLDFWATWCAPCVAETPNLKAAYDAFGKDNRFVMISLSLDSDQVAPKKFVRDQDIAWPQGFLGEWSADKVTQSYGIHGIPAILLISPDGKLLASDLRGSQIKEAVSAALLH